MTTPSGVYHLQRKWRKAEGGGEREADVDDNAATEEFFQLVRVLQSTGKANAGLPIELSGDMVADHGLDRYRAGLESAAQRYQ